MKILPYILALIITINLKGILSSPITILVTVINSKLYRTSVSFWSALFLAGIESFVCLLLSIWIFSWFEFQIPLFYLMLLIIFTLFNNLNRLSSKPDKQKEMGYLIGELISFPAIYYNLIQNDIIQYSFW